MARETIKSLKEEILRLGDAVKMFSDLSGGLKKQIIEQEKDHAKLIREASKEHYNDGGKFVKERALELVDTQISHTSKTLVQCIGDDVKLGVERTEIALSAFKSVKISLLEEL